MTRFISPSSVSLRTMTRNARSKRRRRPLWWTWPSFGRSCEAQALPSISKPLLMAVASWLVVIFFGFGLIAPPNATTMLALGASAFSVACALFLILELDHPLSGLIRIPSEPMINVLNHLAK